METLKTRGVPVGAESTRFDVLSPDGDRFPPKVVIAQAAELETGSPLPRSDFSGGEESNSRLRALGFEIRLKPGRVPTTLTVEAVKAGMVLTEVFSVGNAGGMRWSGKGNALVLIADHTKSLCDDRWSGKVLYYTGMGRCGDQQMVGQNLRLAGTGPDRRPCSPL